MSANTPEHWTPRIGIDIGKVITAASTENNRSLMDRENYLLAPEVEGAIDTLRDVIVPQFGVDNVFLVSKCRPEMQRRTADWLYHIDFFQRTRIFPQHVHFCLERPQKADIARRLGLTDFIDDRQDVLSVMPSDQVMFKQQFAPEKFHDESLVKKRGELFVVNGWRGVRALQAARIAIAQS